MSPSEEQAVTNLGTPELHRRHSVMIEGGKYPRSKVMDQAIFDRYLMSGLIDLRQHRAAESLLDMAAKAGIWAKGVNLDGVYSGTSKSKVFFGMMPLGNALKKIAKECGEVHLYVTKRVIFQNKCVEKQNGIGLFADAMDYVHDNFMSFRSIK